jgi:hypothetical protein
MPANDTALVKVTETTSGGVTSAEKVIKVRVNPYCPLANGIDDLIGSWSGDDAGYTSVIVTTKVGSDLKAQGMGVGFIEDFWGESVVTLGTFKITINIDGTLDIPRQYVFTTLYGGDNYDYEIKGSGTWANCGVSPTFIITYDIYYPGDANGLAKTYASYLGNIPYLTADIALD